MKARTKVYTIILIDSVTTDRQIIALRMPYVGKDQFIRSFTQWEIEQVGGQQISDFKMLTWHEFDDPHDNTLVAFMMDDTPHNAHPDAQGKIIITGFIFEGEDNVSIDKKGG